MSRQIEIDGVMTEVFLPNEVTERENAVRTTVEGEYKPKLTKAETDKKDAEDRLATRTREFGQARTGFQKLTDEQQSKLSETELALYKNQEELAKERTESAERTANAKKSAIETAIRARVGKDENLFTKVKDMYDIVALADESPEQIATRISAAFGALGQTQPDLLATAGFSGGNFEPPRQNNGGESFADTERGKEVAKALGITLEAPKA